MLRAGKRVGDLDLRGGLGGGGPFFFRRAQRVRAIIPLGFDVTQWKALPIPQGPTVLSGIWAMVEAAPRCPWRKVSVVRDLFFASVNPVLPFVVVHVILQDNKTAKPDHMAQKNALQEFLKGLEVSVQAPMQYRGAYVHKFSHIHMTLHAYYAQVAAAPERTTFTDAATGTERALQWATESELEHGALSTQMRNVFALARPGPAKGDAQRQQKGKGDAAPKRQLTLFQCKAQP